MSSLVNCNSLQNDCIYGIWLFVPHWLKIRLFSPQFLNVFDVETDCFFVLVCASKYSGGCISYYPDFHAGRNPVAVEKFENEFV